MNRRAPAKTVLASAPLAAGAGETILKDRDGPDAAGVVPRRWAGLGRRARLFLSTAAMRLDQNTHAFVLATAFLTSVSFAILAMNVLALVLSHLLA